MQIFPVVGPNGKHKHATSKLALRDGGREADSQKKKKRGKAQSLIMRTHTRRKKNAEKHGVLIRKNMFICSPDVL